MTAPTTELTTAIAHEPAPSTVDPRVGEEGGPLIPREVCEAYALRPGHTVHVDPATFGRTLTPVVTDEEAEAYWGPNIWQELEEADAKIKACRTTYFGAAEEFLQALESTRHADV